MKLLFEYQTVEVFNINKNGIQIIENDEYIEIFNDPFRTIPIFIATKMTGDLFIFSNFEDFYTSTEINKEIDVTGFWEIVLFGSGLWDRTLYKKVKQMPGASKITINKRSNKYLIERYWDYGAEEDRSIDSKEKAATGLHERLDDIFSRLNKDNKYVMGMSGGMDSRITLAYLSRHIPKNNVRLFTYGFDEKILEFDYAKKVAATLGYRLPEFHHLTDRSYLDAMNYLPRMSGGQIGINHCHIMDFIKNHQFCEERQISTYFSDAIFGWDCMYPKAEGENIINNPYISQLNQCKFLSDDVVADIIEDSKNVFTGYDTNFNYSSASEYRYVTERNRP